MNKKYLDNVLYLEHFKYNATQNALLTTLPDTNLQNGIFVFYKKCYSYIDNAVKLQLSGRIKKIAFMGRKKLLKHVDVFIHKNSISLKFYLNKPLMKFRCN